jgi:general L-amino acid transport system permease protein
MSKQEALSIVKRGGPHTECDGLPAPRPAPTVKRQRLHELRKAFFASTLNTLISLAGMLFIGWVLWKVLAWAMIDGVFGTSAQSCEATAGACWSVIRSRWRLILFGLYPYDQQWRSAGAAGVAVATICMACAPRMWTGARMLGILAVGYGMVLLLLHGGVLGLSIIDSANWGGLTLTLFIYLTVIAFGLPMAIGLALLRRSPYPAFRWMTALAVDATRSLPLLTILFAAGVIIPLMLPELLQGNRLSRALIGFAFFFACYQSEVIRGGLQALPRGQEEAAKALGLGYWRTTGQILLAQAFRLVMPSTINQFVITFKETSLVVIVGLFDLMASAQTAYQTGEWSSFHTEVYVFVGLIYFAFSFSLSRYGRYVERRFKAKH